jgi:ATP-dependent exoDNAse (exonuclease V) beta subunit
MQLRDRSKSRESSHHTIEAVGEDADCKEVYDTERQWLYVTCTRARDFLMVSGATSLTFKPSC